MKRIYLSLFTIFTIILLISIIIANQACNPTNQNKNRPLLIWESYNNEEHKVFLEIVEDYKKEFPNAPAITVERVPFDGLLSKLITAALARRTPDIARVDIGHIARLAYGKLAAPLDNEALNNHLKNLLPITEEINRIPVFDSRTKKWTENLYGVSDQLTTIALFYNRKMFGQAGLNPDKPPVTWGEFIKYGKKLTIRNKGQFGFGVNLSLWWTMPFLYGFDADILSPKFEACLLNKPETVKAISFLASLYQDDKIEGGAWRAGAINPDQGFVNQKYAMVFSGPWNIKNYSNIDFATSPMPSANNKIGLSNIGGSSMIILANSPYAKEAIHFLIYLTSESAQKKWSERLGQISINKQINSDLLKNPAMKNMHTFIRQIEYTKVRPKIPNYDQLENNVNPILYAIMDKKMAVTEGLNAACHALENSILPPLKE